MAPTANEINRQRHWVCALQLAERRRHLQLTQQDVVDRLTQLGVSATNRTLSAMEHGQGIDIGRLPELAIALECTVTFLLGLTTNPQRWTPDDGTAPAELTEDTVRTTPGDLGCWLHYPNGEDSQADGSWHHGVWHHTAGHHHLPAPPLTVGQVTPNGRPSLKRFAGNGEPELDRVPAHPRTGHA
jgi:transcriptional regulator with XRE-family HTH domain